MTTPDCARPRLCGADLSTVERVRAGLLRAPTRCPAPVAASCDHHGVRSILAPSPGKGPCSVICAHRELGSTRQMLSDMIRQGDRAWTLSTASAPSATDAPRRRGAPTCADLAPFDPVVWDRSRFELWGWRSLEGIRRRIKLVAAITRCRCSGHRLHRMGELNAWCDSALGALGPT